jgi:hypothetical protein
MEHGVIIAACLILGAAGCSVLILWIRDRGGAFGAFLNKVLQVLTVIVYAIAGVFFLINGTNGFTGHGLGILSRDFASGIWSLIEIVLGLSFLWSFGKWFVDWRRGEKSSLPFFRSPEH